MYKKIKQKPMFVQIIDQIKTMILDGTLKPGDMLPPERQFSEMMGVNRHTARTALKVLEYMGVVQAKTAVGTVISSMGQETLVNRLLTAARFNPKRFLLEVMELRQVLEPSIAAFAAQRATDQDMAALDQAMADLTEELEGRASTSDADEALHVALAQAAHNSTFARLTEPIMSLLSEFRERGMTLKGRRAETYKEHQDIYHAVKRRDPEAARSAMDHHLSQVRKMLDRIEADDARGGDRAE